MHGSIGQKGAWRYRGATEAADATFVIDILSAVRPKLGFDTVPVGVSEFCHHSKFDHMFPSYTHGTHGTHGRSPLHALDSSTISFVFVPPRKAAVPVGGNNGLWCL